MNAADDVLEVEQQDDAEDHKHELRDEVRESQHQIDRARLLDADHIHHHQ